MRKLFLLSFFLIFLLRLHAQEGKTATDKNPRVRFRMAWADTSNRHFFEANPSVYLIYMHYKNGKPHDLHLFSEIKAVEDSLSVIYRGEYYDMTFEGDAMVFEQNYPPLRYPNPQIEVSHILGKKMQLHANNESLTVHVQRDTLTYTFAQRDEPLRLGEGEDPAYYQVGVGFPARYIGDKAKLQVDLAKAFAERKQRSEVDSIVVLSAVASWKHGEPLRDVKLIVGKQSAFSDFMQEQLEKPEHKWQPVMIAAAWSREETIRIYTRLNPDGSITLKTPPRLHYFPVSTYNERQRVRR